MASTYFPSLQGGSKREASDLGASVKQSHYTEKTAVETTAAYKEEGQR